MAHRSSATLAESDGTALIVSDHTTFIQELRLSGSYEEDARVESGFVVDIAADGSLSYMGSPDVSVSGQMSSSGDAFVLLARGKFEDGSCDDAFSMVVLGNRI